MQFGFDPQTGAWNLQPAGPDWPRLETARLGAVYEAGGPGKARRVQWGGDLHGVEIEPFLQLDSAQGSLQGYTLRAQTSVSDGEPLRITLVFALPAEQPFLLWRVLAHNGGPEPLYLNRVDLARIGPRASRSPSRLALGPGHSAGAPPRLAFFCHGYQSWSFTGALHSHSRQPSSIFGPLGDPKSLNLVTPRYRRPGRLTSELFGVIADRQAGQGLVAGFLSQREQFGVMEVWLEDDGPSFTLSAQCDDVRLEPGATLSTDWAYLQFVPLSAIDPLGTFIEAVARENQARVPAHIPVGWCSWYHYFDKVTEADVLANAEVIGAGRDRLPLEFVQVDDGFQSQVGDWFETKSTFQHGLRWLSDQIRARGQTPGLWLAPYMVRSDAQLLQQHPDWFLRQSDGRLANAAYNWFRWCYGLDPTHPAVREHVRKLISTAVHEWGFPYLKLDFLYAAALPARRYDSQITRAQAMRLAMTDLRQAAGPDTFLLGCGCPLGSAIGVVDGMRISTDVAPDWHPQLFTPAIGPLLRREMDFVSTRNAIRNSINRAAFHRRWWLNDPDCVLVRDRDTRLTEPEVRSLASAIALSGGMMLVSDDLRRLRPERRRYLTSLLPVLGASAHATGWLDQDMPDLFVLPLSGPGDLGSWVVAGVFNWDETPRARVLALGQLGLDPRAEYLISEFWDAQRWLLPAGQPIRLEAIPAHGARLLAIRRRRPAVPLLAGSTFHFSQGGEVSKWTASDRQLVARLELGRVAEGEWWLALPSVPRAVEIDGRSLPAAEAGDHIYRLAFTVDKAQTLLVNW